MNYIANLDNEKVKKLVGNGSIDEYFIKDCKIGMERFGLEYVKKLVTPTVILKNKPNIITNEDKFKQMKQYFEKKDYITEFHADTKVYRVFNTKI